MSVTEYSGILYLGSGYFPAVTLHATPSLTGNPCDSSVACSTWASYSWDKRPLPVLRPAGDSLVLDLGEPSLHLWESGLSGGWFSQRILFNSSSTMLANLWKVTNRNIQNGWMQVSKQPKLIAYTIIFSLITCPSLTCGLILLNEHTLKHPKVNRGV